MKTIKLNKKGFTLIELLAVIVILSIVLVVTIPSVLNSMNNAKTSQLKNASEVFSDWLTKQYNLSNIDANMLSVDPAYNNFVNAYGNFEESYINASENNGPLSNCSNESYAVLSASGIANPEKNIDIENSYVWKGNNKIEVRLSAKEDGSFFTNDGTNFSYSNSNSVILSNKIYGNSIQNGTPTPSTPVEIESVGDLITDTNDANYGKYKISIKVSGKNLFWLKDATNVSAINQIYNCSNQTFTKEITNLVGITGIISNTTFSQICYCEPLQSGKTYIWKFHNANLLSTGHYFTLTYEDETTENWYENTPITLTKNATITAIRQAYRDYTKGEIESFQIQVEEGSIATDYEPYSSPVTINLYLNEPLRKIGDYADYIDFAKEKVIRNIKEITFDGSENWVKYPTANTNTYYIAIPDSINGMSTSLCNRFRNFQYGAWASSVPDGLYSDHSSLNYKYFRTPDNNTITTLEEFKNWLSTHNTILDYTLKKTIEENIIIPEISGLQSIASINVTTQVPATIE